MTSVVVSGAGGRLGKGIVEQLLRHPSLRLAAGLVSPGSPLLGQDLGLLAGRAACGVLARDDFQAVLQPGSVLLETAVRRAALAHAECAAESQIPILIATTGFEAEERKRLERHARTVPVLIAANLSLGVAVLTDLVARASKALAGYQLEVLEIHHRRKRDAPSGTAWALAAAAATARGQDVERDAILARAGEVGARGEQEIGMQALRGGDVVGEHTVYFFGEDERLELTHRAQSRAAFAAGALAAATFLGSASRSPGLYTMRDVLELGL